MTPFRFVAVLGLCAGCHTSGLSGSANARPTSSSDARAAGDAAVSLASAGHDAGPSAIPRLSVLYQGTCPAARTYRVGTGAAHVIAFSAWTFERGQARSLFRTDSQALYDGITGYVGHLGRVGGIDEAHAWREERIPGMRSTNGEFGILRFAAKAWRVLDIPAASGKPYVVEKVIEQPDGSLWAFVIDGSPAYMPPVPSKFVAISASGDLLTMNLPGADMANAVRLASGEVVDAGRNKQGKPLLRRWSPTHPVDDLTPDGAEAASSPTSLRVGTSRAVLAAPGSKKASLQFYVYDGAQLASAKVNALVTAPQSWMVTAGDDLVVAGAGAELFIEHKDGSVDRELLPEAGTLAPSTNVPWLIAESGALYTRFGGKWAKMSLPDGPWDASGHIPSRVERVETLGDETIVTTLRTDTGFGQKRPTPVRTVYTSGAAAEGYRCGAPFEVGEVQALPLPATATCKTPIVVVGREKGDAPPKSYPRLGAALKGKSALGEALSFVHLGPEKRPLIGILASTEPAARAIAAAAASAATSTTAPEVLCGTGKEVATLRFEVKSGAFSAP